MRSGSAAVSILIVLNILFLAGIIYYYIENTRQLAERESAIKILENENKELKSQVASLDSEREEVKAFLAATSETKESELRNPTWSELKIFLGMDDTNTMIYNDSFDCSGFAIELFKRARNVGLNCGFAEVAYSENISGHMMNAFRTSDMGIIFVDVTGDVNGDGADKIAYVEIGKPYGIVELSAVTEMIVDCDVTCSQFAREVTYVNHSNIMSYDYFVKLKNCISFYEDCVSQYNIAVHDYNRGHDKYAFSELQKWNGNLGILQDELTRGNFYVVSEGQVVKGIQIYW
jgi:hypothetical protein